MGIAALAGAAIVGGGLSYIGGKKAADAQTTAQKDAAAIAARSTEEQLQFLREQKAEQRADVFDLGTKMTAAGQLAQEQRLGYLTSGYNQALGTLQNIDVTQDPSYQFRLRQGLGAIESSAAARGMQLSGRNLRGLQDYAQDFASQEYQRVFARNQAIANMQAQLGTGRAGLVYDPSQVYSQQMGSLTGVGQQYMRQGQNTLAALGQAQAQTAQNIGMIQSQRAMLPYNSLMAGMNTASSLMSMGGMFGGGMGG